MDFIKKNDFIVKNKKKEHFEQDLELFKKHCPNSKLYIDLKRVNQFNKVILVGLMLNELLEKVSPEEILANRGKADIALHPATDQQVPVHPVPDPSAETPVPVPPVPFVHPVPDPPPPENSILQEELESLQSIVDELENSVDSNESDIRDIKDELKENYSFIEKLKGKIDDLKKKAIAKKKASMTSSPE